MLQCLWTQITEMLEATPPSLAAAHCVDVPEVRRLRGGIVPFEREDSVQNVPPHCGKMQECPAQSFRTAFRGMAYSLIANIFHEACRQIAFEEYTVVVFSIMSASRT